MLRKYRAFLSRYGALIAVVLWLIGFVVGMLLSGIYSSGLITLLPIACGIEVSALGICIPALLPFLLSATAVYFRNPVLQLFLVFVKAVSFSACCMGINFAFSSASWLIRLLLIFSGLAGVNVLILFTVRNIGIDFNDAKRDFWCLLILLLCVCSADYFWVSPFLAQLM